MSERGVVDRLLAAAVMAVAAAAAFWLPWWLSSSAPTAVLKWRSGLTRQVMEPLAGDGLTGATRWSGADLHDVAGEVFALAAVGAVLVAVARWRARDDLAEVAGMLLFTSGVISVVVAAWSMIAVPPWADLSIWAPLFSLGAGAGAAAVAAAPWPERAGGGRWLAPVVACAVLAMAITALTVSYVQVPEIGSAASGLASSESTEPSLQSRFPRLWLYLGPGS